jgi:transposase
MTVTPEALKAREERGLIIAAKCKLKQKGPVWLVPSQSSNAKYTVSPDKHAPHCSCPDHETTGGKCKHIFAVEFVIQRELFPDGTVAETKTVTVSETTIRKPTYSQDWPAYNAAQVNEKERFQVLLRDLLQGVEEPAQKPKRGNQPLKVRDALFAAIFKVYSTVSGRRFMSDLRDAKGKGFISHAPCYNSIFKVLENPETFEILRGLIVESAVPLKAIETKFACDSTGFSGSRFDKWFNHKYGEQQIKRAWVKAHVMTGVKTNVVTAVEIHDQFAGDSPLLKPMLATTAQRFKVEEVSADMGYISASNLHAIKDIGASPLIPFKSNVNPPAVGLWGRCFHYFKFHREHFLERYHLRSNVESTFSMVKAKFGDSVRSKTDVAMKNEALAKLLCHNICCLISAIYELGIDPVFWEQQAAS